MDLEVFAERLKELREKRGFSTRKLGLATGFGHGTISMWEGVKMMPSAANVFELARFFGVSMDYLCGLTDKM